MNKNLLLVSAKEISEIKSISKYSDIIDMKNPNDGALGAWNIEQIEKVVKYYSSFCLSATIGNFKSVDEIITKIGIFDSIGLDYIKLGFFNNSKSDIEKTLFLLDKKKLKTKLVAVFFAENRELIKHLNDNFEVYSKSKFSIVMIDTMNKNSGGLLDIYSQDFLKNFIQRSKNYGVKVGLAGKIRLDQVPDLIKMDPFVIGVRSAVCNNFRRDAKISQKLIKQISSYFKSETKNAHAVAGAL